MTADRHPWIELAPGISRLRALAVAHATGGRPVRAESATERGRNSYQEHRCRIDGTVSFAIRKLWRRPHRA
jgi:hypothetical protein